MPDDHDTPEPDPIDEELADIDARDPDVVDEIEQVEEEAERLGRTADQPVGSSDEPNREY